MDDSSDDLLKALAEEHFAQLAEDQAYEVHRERIVEEFKAELLNEYYRSHHDLPLRSLGLLFEAKTLVSISPRAALGLACASLELTVKNLILRPLLHGVVHQGSVADLLADLTIARSAIDRLRGLLADVLSAFANIDLAKYARTGSARPLWEEMRIIQDRRNAALHRGDPIAQADADHAIAVAEHLIHDVVDRILDEAHLRIDSAGHIVADRTRW